MKPSEFSEVLIPPTTKPTSGGGSDGAAAAAVQPPPPYVFSFINPSSKKQEYENPNKTSACVKFFIVFTILAITGLSAALIFTVLRYESKIIEAESRITGLETNLNEFIEAFEIKALLAALHSREHEHFHDEDGHFDDTQHLDSQELDFSIMEPGISSLGGSGHHFRPISDMSDEDHPISFVKPIVNNFSTLDEEDSGSDESDEENFASDSEEEAASNSNNVIDNKSKGRDNTEDGLDENIEEEIVFGELKLKTPENKSHSRNKRQAQQSSRSGVPVIQGSYGQSSTTNFLPVPTPTESEGLRLYESLVATGGQGEPKAREFHESEGSNIQPYHRTSAAWTERSGSSSGRRLELRSGDYGSSYGSGPTIATDYMYNRGQTRPTLPTFHSGSNAIYRQYSRSSTANNNDRTTTNRARFNPPLRKLGEGDGEVVARVHQDGGASTNTNVPAGQASSGANYDGTVTSYAESRHYRTNTGTRQRQRSLNNNNVGGSGQQQQQPPQRQRKATSDYYYDDVSEFEPAATGKADEFSFVKAEAWAEGPKIYSAHYIGDSSNYTLAHRHYEGNGRLKNADGIFNDWKAADWMAGNDASKEGFVLNPDTGIVLVKKEGIYYIYAQVHYLDEHDINGYQININSNPFLQCTTMTETHQSNSRKTKSNTCFTGGLTYLKENDQIQLKDIEINRYSIFRPEKSFFGLMRIGPANSK